MLRQKEKTIEYKDQTWLLVQDWAKEHGFTTVTATKILQRYGVPFEKIYDERVYRTVLGVKIQYEKCLKQAFDFYIEHLDNHHKYLAAGYAGNTETPDQEREERTERWVKIFKGLIPEEEIRSWTVPGFWPETVPTCFQEEEA